MGAYTVSRSFFLCLYLLVLKVYAAFEENDYECE
jgi:hypothetical protein